MDLGNDQNSLCLLKLNHPLKGRILVISCQKIEIVTSFCFPSPISNNYSEDCLLQRSGFQTIQEAFSFKSRLSHESFYRLSGNFNGQHLSHMDFLRILALCSFIFHGYQDHCQNTQNINLKFEIY